MDRMIGRFVYKDGMWRGQEVQDGQGEVKLGIVLDGQDLGQRHRRTGRLWMGGGGGGCVREVGGLRRRDRMWGGGGGWGRGGS